MQGRHSDAHTSLPVLSKDSQITFKNTFFKKLWENLILPISDVCTFSVQVEVMTRQPFSSVSKYEVEVEVMTAFSFFSKSEVEVEVMTPFSFVF